MGFIKFFSAMFTHSHFFCREGLWLGRAHLLFVIYKSYCLFIEIDRNLINVKNGDIAFASSVFFLSSLVVLWDISFVLSRPHSFPGGSLHHFFTPC